jgi:hypothetical protein
MNIYSLAYYSSNAARVSIIIVSIMKIEMHKTTFIADDSLRSSNNLSISTGRKQVV